MEEAGPCNCRIEVRDGGGKILSCAFCNCEHYENCNFMFDDGDENPDDIFAICYECYRTMACLADDDSGE